jgi:hypothetical protein
MIYLHELGGEVTPMNLKGKWLKELWEKDPLSCRNLQAYCSRAGCEERKVLKITMVENQQADTRFELIPFCQSCSDSFHSKTVALKPRTVGVLCVRLGFFSHEFVNHKIESGFYENWTPLVSGDFLIERSTNPEMSTPHIYVMRFLRLRFPQGRPASHTMSPRIGMQELKVAPPKFWDRLKSRFLRHPQ